MPTVPVKAAGWRIEPPVSVAVAPAQSQRGHRRRRAAGRAARHQRRVRAARAPRVDHRAVIGGLVGRAHGELVHVELAEHDRAVGPEIGGHGRLVDRLEAVEDVARRLGVDALGAEQVLDAERHAFERPRLAGGDARVRLGGHGQRLLRRLDDIGVERRAPPPSRTDRPGQLGRGEALRPRARRGFRRW